MFRNVLSGILAAVMILGNIPAAIDAVVVEKLIKMALQDPAEMVRATACLALGWIGYDREEAEPRVVGCLTAILTDFFLLDKLDGEEESWIVRERAIRALGWLGPRLREHPATIHALEKETESDNEWLRYHAVVALGRVGAGVSPLQDSLRDRSARVRREAVEAIYQLTAKGEWHPSFTAQDLIEMMGDKEAQVKEWAEIRLQDILREQPLLARDGLNVATTWADDEESRRRAAEWFERIPPPSVEYLIHSAQSEEDQGLQIRAIEELRRVMPPPAEAVPALLCVVADKRLGLRSVRLQAVETLRVFRNPSSVPILFQAIIENEEEVAEEALWALIDFGEIALPQLMEYMLRGEMNGATQEEQKRGRAAMKIVATISARETQR